MVAAEVKSLAEQTAKATEQISAQVSSIQTSSSEAVSAIKGITATINEMSEIASAIAGAVEEQGSATQEIARNVQQAALGTSEISSNVTGCSAGRRRYRRRRPSGATGFQRVVQAVGDDARSGRVLPQQHQGRLIDAALGHCFAMIESRPPLPIFGPDYVPTKKMPTPVEFEIHAVCSRSSTMEARADAGFGSKSRRDASKTRLPVFPQKRTWLSVT